MKKILLCLCAVCISACSSAVDEKNSCPPINIPRETMRLYQNNGRFDEFQVNLVGFESYCYTHPSNNRRYARITPLFKVRRLEDSATTSLDIEFFVKTSINAEDYLGIRNFNQTLNIPRSSREEIIKGRPTVTRIDNQPYQNFSISLGILMNKAEQAKAHKMFDIDYRYLSAEELAAQNDPEVETIYMEIAPDEEIIYSETDKHPIVVKKDRPKNPCQN